MANAKRGSLMGAWRKHRGNKEPQWEQVPVPKVTPTGLLCKVLAMGVCHSDYSLLNLNDTRPWVQDEYILGHEGCGEIVEVGAEVSGFKIGDRIALFAIPGCGADDCPECTRDLAQLCPRGHHSGIGQDGFYTQYAVIDQKGAALVPEGVSSGEAAVATDAVTTAYHAVVRRGEVKPTETVFLFGLGGLGFNGLQVIKHIGARVIVSDVREERLDEAERLGIPRRDIVPAGTSVVEFVKNNDLQGKIDTVLDFVGMKQTIDDGQEIVRAGGKIVCIGTLNTDNNLNMKTGVRKRLTILFSYGGQRRDLEEVLSLIDKDAIRPQLEHGKLSEFPAKLQDLHEGKIKARIVLLPD